jgi:DNA-directed RNA polymerase-3 subunit RPC5
MDVDMEHDPDPIKASYDVYIKPHISEDRQIFILQFPNRDSKQQYSAAYGAMPMSLRVKPEAAMVEMDVPMDAYQNYDREKGARWGDAMLKSKGGIHGLPGGFGIGGTTGGRGRGKPVEEDDIGHRRVLADYPTAVQDSKVLIKQTLGGQAVPGDETTPKYMVGTFRNGTIIPFELQSSCL